MNLHEYQSKELMSGYGIPVPAGRLCLTAAEAGEAYAQLGSAVAVVKAQVHAGGRGKGGGIKLVKSAAEAEAAAGALLGTTLVTPQTGARGRPVRKLYLEAGCNIAREFYLSLLVDRSRKCVAIIASTAGGMEIEEVAKNDPAKIIKSSVDLEGGVSREAARGIAGGLGLEASLLEQFETLLAACYRLFLEKDLSLLEINPLVQTREGRLLVLDAKCTVDDNALFRRPELAALQDIEQLDPRDYEAGKFGLNYIGLDGNIGVMVNGAGLAMATMDIIKQSGGSPANFLDVGGGASQESVSEAFRILVSDPNVKAILVNIFGGIVRCDVIANGIVNAARNLQVAVPLVVRLQGTNVDLGRRILGESGLNITPVNTMAEAAQVVVAASR